MKFGMDILPTVLIFYTRNRQYGDRANLEVGTTLALPTTESWNSYGNRILKNM
jgi:hypothetical protein